MLKKGFQQKRFFQQRKFPWKTQAGPASGRIDRKEHHGEIPPDLHLEALPFFQHHFASTLRKLGIQNEPIHLSSRNALQGGLSALDSIDRALHLLFEGLRDHSAEFRIAFHHQYGLHLALFCPARIAKDLVQYLGRIESLHPYNGELKGIRDLGVTTTKKSRIKKEDSAWLSALGRHIHSKILEKGFKSPYEFWVEALGDQVSRASLNYVLNGSVDVRATTLRRIAEALEMDHQEIFNFRV